MPESIKTLRPEMLLGIADGEPSLYVKDDFAFLHHIGDTFTLLKQKMLEAPQYIEVGRLVRVLNGKARFTVNMMPEDLEKGCVLVIPENSYIEVNNLSDDFDVQIISFKDMPVSLQRPACLKLQQDDYSRIGEYLNLIWELIHRDSFSMKTVHHLMDALMDDLSHMMGIQESQSLSRSETMMQAFVDLVASSGSKQRNVQFYADKLNVSPNYLSSFVRKYSGKTVMQWLNERTSLQAKALLRHTDSSISEIAFQLNFSEVTLFCRFFKRETGLTPKEYRNQSLSR